MSVCDLNVSLREASAADSEPIAEVLLASHKAFLAFAPGPYSDEQVRDWVRDVLLPSEAVTVAVAQGSVIGVLAVKRVDDMSWVTQLYLHPSHVGLGIGSRLLAHAVARLPLPIRLYTFQQNSGARRFYERNGFSAIQFTDGSTNLERSPDVLYEMSTHP